jgi:hypothetical protein
MTYRKRMVRLTTTAVISGVLHFGTFYATGFVLSGLDNSRFWQGIPVIHGFGEISLVYFALLITIAILTPVRPPYASLVFAVLCGLLMSTPRWNRFVSRHRKGLFLAFGVLCAFDISSFYMGAGFDRLPSGGSYLDQVPAVVYDLTRVFFYPLVAAFELGSILLFFAYIFVLGYCLGMPLYYLSRRMAGRAGHSPENNTHLHSNTSPQPGP